jgi:glyoxylase-like metal-dependent hydrolase (beta-lactamase superfamily II)
MLTVKVFTFNPVQENSYLLYNEAGECILIDPGCYFPEESAELLDFVKKQALKPQLLLNTHCHFDHVFGNRFVNETWGLEPWIHPLEKPVLERADQAAMRWQLPFENYQGAVHLLDESVPVKLGEDELQVIWMPGHSPGSVGFFHSGQQFIIAGDVLFRGSIGRTDLPGGDHETLIKSIQTKMYQLPPDTIVYPGHGPATRIFTEMKSNPFVKAAETD